MQSSVFLTLNFTTLENKQAVPFIIQKKKIYREFRMSYKVKQMIEWWYISSLLFFSYKKFFFNLGKFRMIFHCTFFSFCYYVNLILKSCSKHNCLHIHGGIKRNLYPFVKFYKIKNWKLLSNETSKFRLNFTYCGMSSSLNNMLFCLH